MEALGEAGAEGVPRDLTRIGPLLDIGYPMLTLDHVQIAAPPGCEAAARAFFSGLLGLPELSKQGETASSGGAWFSLGGGELHVGVEAEHRPSRKAHVALRLPDEASLVALAERLAAAGHAVRWDTRLPDVRRFFTDDPWGNRVELLVRPG